MSLTKPSLMWRLTDWWEEVTRRPAAKSPVSNDTLEGLKENLRREIMKADRDRDGRVSPAEWLTWRQNHPFAAEFNMLDMNRDGYITPDDIDVVAARRFVMRERAKARAARGEGKAQRPFPRTPKVPPTPR